MKLEEVLPHLRNGGKVTGRHDGYNHPCDLEGVLWLNASELIDGDFKIIEKPMEFKTKGKIYYACHEGVILYVDGEIPAGDYEITLKKI